MFVFQMRNPRKYGNLPFHLVLVHGGPGAPGELALVASKLSIYGGTLEPIQTAGSIDGQIDELKRVLIDTSELPVVLLGHSWGAWLCFMLTAKYPKLVKKLILVSSGPFMDKYAKNITETRLSRLDPDERTKLKSILTKLNSAEYNDSAKDIFMGQMGKLIKKADSYELLHNTQDHVECQYKIYSSIWPEAEILRRTGRLLKLGEHIQCPVLAIHGEYDPHPAEGVKVPLTEILLDFKFILLKNCGHYPWLEKQAKDEFYNVLKSELALPFKELL